MNLDVVKTASKDELLAAIKKNGYKKIKRRLFQIKLVDGNREIQACAAGQMFLNLGAITEEELLTVSPQKRASLSRKLIDALDNNPLNSWDTLGYIYGSIWHLNDSDADYDCEEIAIALEEKWRNK